jgi:hypothetical protein
MFKTQKKQLGISVRSAISLALAAGVGMPGLTAAQQTSHEVEQVVVSGSYIRRSEGFIPASPVSPITSDRVSVVGAIQQRDTGELRWVVYFTGV